MHASVVVSSLWWQQYPNMNNNNNLKASLGAHHSRQQAKVVRLNLKLTGIMTNGFVFVVCINQLRQRSEESL